MSFPDSNTHASFPVSRIYLVSLQFFFFLFELCKKSRQRRSGVTSRKHDSSPPPRWSDLNLCPSDVNGPVCARTLRNTRPCWIDPLRSPHPQIKSAASHMSEPQRGFSRPSWPHRHLLWQRNWEVCLPRAAPEPLFWRRLQKAPLRPVRRRRRRKMRRATAARQSEWTWPSFLFLGLRGRVGFDREDLWLLAALISVYKFWRVRNWWVIKTHPEELQGFLWVKKKSGASSGSNSFFFI